MKIFRLPKYLQDLCKMSGKTRNDYTEDVCKICLEDVFKTAWRLEIVCWALVYLINALEFCLGFEVLQDFSLFIFGSD